MIKRVSVRPDKRIANPSPHPNQWSFVGSNSPFCGPGSFSVTRGNSERVPDGTIQFVVRLVPPAGPDRTASDSLSPVRSLFDVVRSVLEQFGQWQLEARNQLSAFEDLANATHSACRSGIPNLNQLLFGED